MRRGASSVESAFDLQRRAAAELAAEQLAAAAREQEQNVSHLHLPFQPCASSIV